MKQYKFADFSFFKGSYQNKIIGLAYNYKSLIGDKKIKEPLVFFKSNTSLIFNQENISYNVKLFDKVWIEAELCIIIGKEGKNINTRNAKDYILGYSCGNDVTAENILQRDWHLARSKGPDTFAPIGPNIITDIDTSNLRIRSFINGKNTQDSFTSDRVLNDYESIAFVSKFFKLFPGDIIFTGTPKGATDAIVKPGDEAVIEIENIGILKNKIISSN